MLRIYNGGTRPVPSKRATRGVPAQHAVQGAFAMPNAYTGTTWTKPGAGAGAGVRVARLVLVLVLVLVRGGPSLHVPPEGRELQREVGSAGLTRHAQRALLQYKRVLGYVSRYGIR